MSKSFQELHRMAPASFQVVCKTFLEASQELCFQGRVKAGFLHLGTTFTEDQTVTVSQWAVDSTVLLYSSLQASATTVVAAHKEELAWVPDPSVCSCCAHRQRGQVTTGFLTERPVQNKQLAEGWGMGKCWFGSAPSYSHNPLLTPSPPIFGCFPWSRHCFPTAPFQKELKETSSVAFSLVCAKTVSYTKASWALTAAWVS